MPQDPSPSLMEEIKRREAHFRQLVESSQELHSKLAQRNALHRVPTAGVGTSDAGCHTPAHLIETPESSCSAHSVKRVEPKKTVRRTASPPQSPHSEPGPAAASLMPPRGEDAPGMLGAGSLPTSREDDAVVEFMVKQLGVLLAEKARLAEDNARLLRENSSLHDILSISMSFDDCDVEDEDGCEEAITLEEA